MQRYLGILLSAALLSTGCASWFMNGGRLLDDDAQPTVKAKYTLSMCTMSDGSSVKGPDGLFQLVQDGPEVGIMEPGSDGMRALITNKWSDDKGDHYFGWVMSSGWEYVIPKDPAVPPTRLVYVGLETKTEGTVTKPVSAVAGTCPMVPAT